MSSLGGLVAWLDTSTQVWGTDGNSLTEVGLDIRTDLKTIDQTKSSVTFHISGEAHWLCVSTGTKVFVSDMDLEMWMPPWVFTSTYIGSFEVSLGTYALVAATSTKALQLNQSGTVGKYNDNGSTYQPVAAFGLKSIVPDFQNASPLYADLYSEPTKTGVLTGVQADTNSNALSDIAVVLDDDPTNTSTVYSSIARYVVTPQVAYGRGQGANLIQNIYPMPQTNAVGRLVGVKVTGQNADDNLRLYGLIIGFDRLGGV